jgi:hypothetical protein
MHGMGGPEDGDLVAETVEPVVTQVPGQRGRYPERDAARRGIEPAQRHIDERKVLEYKSPGDERQQLREITDRGAQCAGAETVDRIVGAIQPRASTPVYRQFDEHCEQEKRDGSCDQVHPGIVTGPIMRVRPFLR